MGAAVTPQLPSYPTDDASAYAVNLDASARVAAAVAAAFAPHAVPSSPSSPALSQVAGGALGGTTYYVKTTFVTDSGEVVPSAEASLAVAANNLLKVTAPAVAGGVAGVTGWNVYVSTSAGTETKQNGSTPIALGTDWTEPGSGLVAGTALPAGLSVMSILVEAGSMFANGAVVTKTQQNSATFVAPVSNPRIDRVVMDPVTGVISVVAGAEAASPVAPAITSGKLPICQIALATSTTAIGNSLITDERSMILDAVQGESDVATAATPGVFAAPSRIVKLTGTTSMTAFDSALKGTWRFCYFESTGARLVYSANLLNPIPFDIQVMAGDSCMAEAMGGGVTKIHWYRRADGQRLLGGYIPFGVCNFGIINATASATQYVLPGAGSASQPTEHFATYVIPESCTVSELRIVASAALAGGTAAFTARKNGVDTTLTCTLAAASGTTASDSTHSVDLEEGDLLSLKLVTGAIGATTDFGATIVIKKKGFNVGVGIHMSFNSGVNSVNANSAVCSYVITTEADSEIALPPCRIETRSPYSASANGTAGTWLGASLRRNSGSPGAAFPFNQLVNPMATIRDGATGRVNSPGTRGPTLQYAEGDLFNIRGVDTDSDYVNIRHAYGLLGPTDAQYHQSLLRYACGSQAQALTRYAGAYSGNGAGGPGAAQSATETDVQVPMPACTLRGLRVASNTVVAAGQNCVITIRKNGVDQTITCTLTNASRLASDLANSVSFAAGDLLSIKVVSSATAGTHTYNITIEVNPA